MLKLKQRTHQAMQAGFSLLEILVTVIILGVGLLGLAGLQSIGLTYSQSASFRSMASMLAYSMLDSMRANRGEAGQGYYNLAIGAAKPAGSTIPEQDLIQWLNELALSLPAGTGAIDVDASNKVTITIQWDDSRGALPAQQLVMATRL
ncbi:type IV pilus modification protein PilV [Nitrosomonas sp. ANs5]|uniref:type IV pilus modification protein PilV n=1 Tax=Nitrosomonas sp. ANs5 TaxID=3423941 RepID=UPI003D355F45